MTREATKLSRNGRAGATFACNKNLAESLALEAPPDLTPRPGYPRRRGFFSPVGDSRKAPPVPVFPGNLERRRVFLLQ